MNSSFTKDWLVVMQMFGLSCKCLFTEGEAAVYVNVISMSQKLYFKNQIVFMKNF